MAAEDKSHRFWRLKSFINKLKIHAGSLENYASIINIITKIKPMRFIIWGPSYIDYALMNFQQLILILMEHIFCCN